MKMRLLLLMHGGLQFSLALAAASEAAKLIFFWGGGLFYCIKNDMDILLSGQWYFVDVFFDDTVSHLEYTVLWYGCLLTVALDIKHCRFDGNFSDSKWGC